MRRSLLTTILVVLLTGCHTQQPNLVIGSKNFTEQTVLGEIVAQHIENKTGLRVERHFYLAGSYICHQAMLADVINLFLFGPADRIHDPHARRSRTRR